MAELGFELSGMTLNTLMHDAACEGNLEIVKLLTKLGADPIFASQTTMPSRSVGS